jgi:hypothetical protein
VGLLGDSGGTFAFASRTPRLLSVPAPGLASLDLDVAINDTATCDDEW